MKKFRSASSERAGRAAGGAAKETAGHRVRSVRRKRHACLRRVAEKRRQSRRDASVVVEDGHAHAQPGKTEAEEEEDAVASAARARQV